MIIESFNDPFNVELAHADFTEVESDIETLAEAVSYVMKDRLDPDKAKYVEQFEGRLLASLASLQLICSELREVRIRRAA